MHSIYKKINMISVIFALLSSTEGIRTEPARRLLVNGSVISDNAGTPILLRGYAHVTPPLALNKKISNSNNKFPVLKFKLPSVHVSVYQLEIHIFRGTLTARQTTAYATILLVNYIA